MDAYDEAGGSGGCGGSGCGRSSSTRRVVQTRATRRMSLVWPRAIAATRRARDRGASMAAGRRLKYKLQALRVTRARALLRQRVDRHESAPRVNAANRQARILCWRTGEMVCRHRPAPVGQNRARPSRPSSAPAHPRHATAARAGSPPPPGRRARGCPLERGRPPHRGASPRGRPLRAPSRRRGRRGERGRRPHRRARRRRRSRPLRRRVSARPTSVPGSRDLSLIALVRLLAPPLASHLHREGAELLLAPPSAPSAS